MHMAAIAYNLKKYLKFITKNPKNMAAALALYYFTQKSFIKLFLEDLSPSKIIKLAFFLNKKQSWKDCFDGVVFKNHGLAQRIPVL